MNLTLIDNGFYKITASQAKQLSVTGKLPRLGYQIGVTRTKLRTVICGEMRGGQWKEFDFNPELATSAWVQRTPLKWWNGKEVKLGWVWALALYW